MLAPTTSTTTSVTWTNYSWSSSITKAIAFSPMPYKHEMFFTLLHAVGTLECEIVKLQNWFWLVLPKDFFHAIRFILLFIIHFTWIATRTYKNNFFYYFACA